jgi:hypothetical protein
MRPPMNWQNDSILLFDELIQPIPVFVRVMIKKGIKKKIVEVASKEQASSVEKDHVLQGFILATPKGSVQRTKTMMDSKNIDYSKYESLFNET